MGAGFPRWYLSPTRLFGEMRAVFNTKKSHIEGGQGDGSIAGKPIATFSCKLSKLVYSHIVFRPKYA